MRQFESSSEKEAYYAKRRKRGLIVGSIGGGLLGLGFLLQYILYMQGTSFDAVMYIFSSVGIGLVLFAAIEVFGW